MSVWCLHVLTLTVTVAVCEDYGRRVIYLC